MNYIENAGFTGGNWFLAGHSLGGLMTQDFLRQKHDEHKADPSVFKGQILISSVLQRETREIQPDGTTKFLFPTPTLTVGGTKDGLMRITRVAESYYHSWENITPE